jgi:tetratricopeptide (TPR) repeat protein
VRVSAPTKDRVAPNRRSRSRAVVVAAALLMLAAHVALAADPFYMRQLREGSDDFNRRDWQNAIRHLRVACFGLLDEPLLLADGLTRLALAQGAGGDLEGVRATFQRLVEIEERFDAYGKADIAPDMRKAVEDLFVAVVPEATLRTTPAFARLVPSPQQRVAALPPKQRRTELERLVRQQPGEVAWPVMLAELELEEGNAKRAFEAAEQAVAIAPENPSALRVHGLAAAASASAGAPPTPICRRSARRRATRPRPRRCSPRCSSSAARPRRSSCTRAFRSRSGCILPSPRLPSVSGRGKALPARCCRVEARRCGSLPRAAPSRELARSRDLVNLGKVGEAYAVARVAADTNPNSVEAQHAAAESAYRNGRWAESRGYFERGGTPGDDQPLRQFYYAVVLVETGDREAAAAVLRRCLPRIRRTDYVKRYEAKILGAESAR